MSYRPRSVARALSLLLVCAAATAADGPATARAVKEGLVLRIDEHRGGTVSVHR
jgi:hypothetical protein